MAKQKSTPRTTSTNKKASDTRPIDPALNRPANADESSPETLVPDIVHSSLQKTASNGSSDLQERISKRAYELAAQRGFAPGSEVEDWLRAEKELQAAPSGQAAPEDQFTG